MQGPMVAVEGIRKAYGATKALDGVDLEVEAGQVFGLLGPNGAGKTTLVRILATLLRPDGGQARVAGLDVTTDAALLRTIIGLAGQYAAVDEVLTGRENLELVGHLYHLPRHEVRERATDVLERLDLAGAADRPVRTYSGGMRRRLDLGASLVGRPEVLILDEPTTGLDPRSRQDLWEFIEDLVGEGTTVLLTTQYLDEADRLASSLAVIDHGRVIAEGTPDQLKDRLGDVVELTVSTQAELGPAAELVRDLAADGVTTDERTRKVKVPVANGSADLLAVVRRLDDDEAVLVEDVSLRRPSLDDVFLALTGHGVERDDDAERSDAPSRRGPRLT